MKMIQLTDNLWVRTQDITLVALDHNTAWVTVSNKVHMVPCKDPDTARKTAENIVKELEELE